MFSVENEFSENKQLIHHQFHDNSFVQHDLLFNKILRIIDVDYVLKSNNVLVSIPFYKTESSILMYMKFFDFFDEKNQKTSGLKSRFISNVIHEIGMALFKPICFFQLPIDTIVSLFCFQNRLNSTFEWTIKELVKNKNPKRKLFFKATKLTLQSITAPIGTLAKGIFMSSIGFEFYISRINNKDKDECNNYFKICKRINELINVFEWKFPVENHNERLFYFIQKMSQENDLLAQTYISFKK
ncbi:hypothetical protein PNK_1257 [Candidatus Protochlamydia naegleriophila]|uniref:Uncharacterized protein n=1 Tax=Candidatus Protochlamydia naegleriophila TaxID=389348 RepID=A0A0U5JDJ3_9BACT|nr:hypothetical protein [Candidatus Protochlamydia naegleriophila]CUI16874.1 hypothetical protein PNK_1257 [Candidatus Protochlamydia naegleriophila]